MTLPARERIGSGRRGIVADLPAGQHAIRGAAPEGTGEYMLLVDRLLPAPIRQNPYAE